MSQFMQKKQKTVDMRKRHPPVHGLHVKKKFRFVYAPYG